MICEQRKQTFLHKLGKAELRFGILKVLSKRELKPSYEFILSLNI